MDRIRLGMVGLAMLALGACGGDGGGGSDASVVDGGTLDGSAPDGGATDDGGALDGSTPEDGGTLGDGGAGVDEAEIRRIICEPLAAAVCDAIAGCGCGAAVPDCAADQSVACTRFQLQDGRAEALASGQLRIDAEAVRSCVARARAAVADCSLTNGDYQTFCMGVLVDTAAVGGACAPGSMICAGGAGFCQPTSPTAFRCVARPGMGALCEPGACAAGLACNGGRCGMPLSEGLACESAASCAEGLLCVGGTCRTARVAAGGACTRTDECVVGATCTMGACQVAASTTCAATMGGGPSIECPSLSGCVADSVLECVPPAVEGAPCEAFGAGCATGLYCDDATPSAPVCRAFPVAGLPCRFGQCDENAWCSPDDRCEPLGLLGELCVTAGFGDGCGRGLSCVGGTCVEIPGVGMPCGDFGECADGAVCLDDGAGGRLCAPPGAVGDACDFALPNGGCSALGYCDPTSTVCLDRLPEGAPCMGFDMCAEGLGCVFDPADPFGGSGTCQVLPARGEACPSGLCGAGLLCASVRRAGMCEPSICEVLPTGGSSEAPPPGPVPATPVPARS